jgi:hypothetical protein
VPLAVLSQGFRKAVEAPSPRGATLRPPPSAPTRPQRRRPQVPWPQVRSLQHRCANHAPELAGHHAYLPAQALGSRDAAEVAAAAAAAADAHVVLLHLTQRAFPSASHLFKFANSVVSSLQSIPEPLLGCILISTDALITPAAAPLQWQPLQSFMVHNATHVPHSSIRAAVAMSHSVSVRCDLCQTFSLAAARESACHFPRELSYDFGFLSKYGA